MTCTKCEQPPEHSILIREGEMPKDPSDPDYKKKDRSSVKVVQFCSTHWQAFKEFLDA